MPPSLVRAVFSIFSEKTATSLTTSAFVPYPIHVVLHYTNALKIESLINNRYTIFAFLHVFISDLKGAQDNSVDDILDDAFHLQPLDDDV